MGATAVDVTEIEVVHDVNQLEAARNVQGSLADFRSVDILRDVSNTHSSGTNNIAKYQVFVATANGAGPTDVSMFVRQVRVPKNIGTPLVVSNFFAGILEDTTLKLHALNYKNTDSFVEYDIFASFVGATTNNVDLYVITVAVPEGVTDPNFPVLPLANDPVATTVVLRSVEGGVKTYDYFMLSND